MGDLSEHFSKREFECKCGCGFGSNDGDVKPGLIDGLEKLRAMCCELKGRDVPITISGGARCRSHNAVVGGAPQSRHVVCDAADIKAPGFTGAELHVLAEQVSQFANGGIGLYHNRIHVDDRGYRARWKK